MKVSRRTFVQAGTAAGAGLLFLRLAGDPPDSEAAEAAVPAYEWRSNVCGICPNFCGIKVKVETRDGIERAVKIEGDPENTYNRGRTCARGQAGLRTVYSENRIKQPLIRVEGSKRGEWDFRAATWDEAYDYIMARLEENEVKPHEISIVGGWLTCSTYSPYLVPFCMATGIPNLTASTIQRCMCGHAIGLGSVLGIWNSHAEISSDTENAALILNLRTNCSASASAGRIVEYAEGIRNGAVVVTADPRHSEAVRFSDKWLQIKPGSDDALLLAIMNQLYADGTYDESFLALHTNAPFLAYERDGVLRLAMTSDPETGTPAEFFVYDSARRAVVAVPGVSNRNDADTNGAAVAPALDAEAEWNGIPVKTVFSLLREKVAGFTPEWAAEVCEVEAEDLAWVTEHFSRTRPALIYGGWADARYDTSYMTWKLAGMVQAMTGGIDRPGGWVFSGSGRGGVQNWWKAVQAGTAPGWVSMKKMLHLIDDVFDNPAMWPHNPSLHRAYNESLIAQGKPPHPFTIFGDMGLHESVRGELTYKGEPYLTKAIIMTGANPVRSFFSEEDWKNTLTSENVKLVVNTDILATDSAAYADVILPDLSYLERHDPISTAESIDLTYVTRTPVTPVVDGRHTLDVFFDLAERMGALETYIKKLAGSMGADLDAFRAQISEARDAGRSVAEVIEQLGVAKAAAKVGITAEQMTESLAGGAVVAKGRDELMKGAGIPYTYPALTESGRIELYSALYAGFIDTMGVYRAEVDPLAAYAPPVFDTLAGTGALADNEFFMVYGKAPTMTHTSTADNDLLMAITQNKPGVHTGIWMNPARASALGVAQGDSIILENAATGQTVDGHAYLTEFIRSDTLFIPSNFGHQNGEQQTAAGVGSALNRLVARQTDAVAAGSMISQLTVRVHRA